MKLALENELASTIRFILDAATGLTPYYWDVPKGFVFPAVYFPPPVLSSQGDTFSTYALEYEWFIMFFAATDGEAQTRAMTALDAICAARRLIPLIDEQGEPTGRGIRLKDPAMKKADDGAYQIELRWDSRRPYNAAEYPSVETINVTINDAYRAAIARV